MTQYLGKPSQVSDWASLFFKQHKINYLIFDLLKLVQLPLFKLVCFWHSRYPTHTDLGQACKLVR
jgi:hypothetical protein